MFNIYFKDCNFFRFFHNLKLAIIVFTIVLILFMAGSCATPKEKNILGRWENTIIQDERTDTYIFRINQDIWGRLFGNITTYMDGNLLPSTQISNVDFDFPYFSMKIENMTTPLKYSGKMNDDKTMLIGKFDYANPNIESVDFTLYKSENESKQIEEYTYHMPRFIGFTSMSASEAGLDESEINKMINSIRKKKYGLINSIIIVKDNSLVLEEYFNGFKRNKLHQIQSITKSITSILIGIAIDMGFIASVDDKVLNYLSEKNHAHGWENVTLRHLLTMTSGVKWKKPNGVWDNDESVPEILMKSIIVESGTKFQYNSAMQLLAEVLVNATGVNIEKFTEKYLFQPLSIEEYQWAKSTKNDYPLCTGSLQLRPIDLAKIGTMILNNGLFLNTQILSKSWIEESTSIQIKIPKNKNQHYGYLWWRGEVETRSGNFDTIFAHGFGSQFIFVIPQKKLVIVTTGNNLFNKKQLAPFKMLKKYLRFI